MTYPFLDTTNDLSPINDVKSVTPNDAADLPDGACRAMIFTGAGNVRFMTLQGSIVTLPISSAWFGVSYLRARRIYATGTTATGIFACY
jgi:hypothetical protein